MTYCWRRRVSGGMGEMADRSGEAARMLPANGVRLDMLGTIASLFVLSWC